MFFSFPTSFLCFSWNSFAASSCGQGPTDRVGQRQAGDKSQKQVRGRLTMMSSHLLLLSPPPPPLEAALTQVQTNIKHSF